MSNTLEIGKPNYSGNRGEKLTFYRLGMKDNQRELVMRIAPPIKDLASKGDYAIYLKQHFGYSVAGKGDKRIPQTFNCIERKDKNKNIVQECPECNEIAMRKADVESKTAKLKASNTAEEIIEAQLRPAKAWLKEHNCDRKWNMLAKNEGGQWGFLAISHTCYEDLQREIKELAKLGIEDPLGVDRGVWFRFNRAGQGFNDVKDTVTAVKTANGENIVIKRDTLVATDFAALQSLPNLTGMGRKLTYEQIKSLVLSGGDESAVKAIFQSAAPIRGETSPVPVTQPTGFVPTTATTTPVVESASVPPVVVAEARVASIPPDFAQQFAAMQAELTKLRGGTPAPVAAPVVEKPISQTIAPNIARSLDMDVDQFVAQFGTDNE